RLAKRSRLGGIRVEVRIGAQDVLRVQLGAPVATRRVIELLLCGLEQLRNVRRTVGSLAATADSYVVRDTPIQQRLVGIYRFAWIVIRPAISQLEVELLGARLAR